MDDPAAAQGRIGLQALGRLQVGNSTESLAQIGFQRTVVAIEKCLRRVQFINPQKPVYIRYIAFRDLADQEQAGADRAMGGAAGMRNMAVVGPYVGDETFLGQIRVKPVEHAEG